MVASIANVDWCYVSADLVWEDLGSEEIFKGMLSVRKVDSKVVRVDLSMEVPEKKVLAGEVVMKLDLREEGVRKAFGRKMLELLWGVKEESGLITKVGLV